MTDELWFFALFPPPAPAQAEADRAMHSAPAASEAARILGRIRTPLCSKVGMKLVLI